MGILVCKTPKGVTGRRGTGGMAAVGGTWTGRSERSTARDSSSEHPEQETTPGANSQGGVAGRRDSSEPEEWKTPLSLDRLDEGWAATAPVLCV